MFEVLISRSSSASTDLRQRLVSDSGGELRLIGEDSSGACCVTMQGLWKLRLGLGIDAQSTGEDCAMRIVYIVKPPWKHTYGRKPLSSL